MKEKTLFIESQVVTTPFESQLLRKYIEMAAEAGYTKIRDVWGYHMKFGYGYDEYSMEEMLQRFKEEDAIIEEEHNEWYKNKMNNPNRLDELPF